MRKESIIDLAVVSSPWIKVENNNPKILYWFGKLMYKIYPKLSVRGTVERNINEENKSSLKDPLAHDKLTPQLFFDCEKAGLWLYENPTKLTIPILLMHGSNDLLTSFSASQEFALKSEYVEFKSWEGRGHILHKENKYEKVLKFAENWISEKLK